MALLEERRKKLAAEGLFAAERKRAAALPARGDRRRHLAVGCGDPGHPAPPGGALPAPGAAVAGAGPGRARGRAGRGRDPGLQSSGAGRCGAAARRPDRRPRRRLARGPLAVQRGGRGPGRGRKRDPADLGGRPRDRHDADRPCRRPARADADRGGRARRAGPRRARQAPRPARPAPVPRRRSARCASSSSGSSGSRAACPTRWRCSARRRSASTISPSACRTGCARAASGRGASCSGSHRGSIRRCARCMRHREAELQRPQPRASASTRSARGCRACCAASTSSPPASDHARRAAGSMPPMAGSRRWPSLLGSLSYRGVLARGFALVRDEQAQLVDSAARARTQAALELEFRDGKVQTVVARGLAGRAAGRRHRRRAGPAAVMAEAGHGADRAPALGHGAAARP